MSAIGNRKYVDASVSFRFDSRHINNNHERDMHEDDFIMKTNINEINLGKWKNKKNPYIFLSLGKGFNRFEKKNYDWF